MKLGYFLGAKHAEHDLQETEKLNAALSAGDDSEAATTTK